MPEEKAQVESTETPAEDTPAEETPDTSGLDTSDAAAFDEFMNDDDDDLDVEPETGTPEGSDAPVSAEEPEQPAEEAPAAEAAKDAPPEETPPAQPEARQPEPQQPTPPEQTATPEPPQPEQTQEELEAALREQQAAAETRLAEEFYALSEDQQAEFESDAGVAIPKLAARIHMAAAAGAVQHIMRNFPVWFKAAQEQFKREDANNQKFWDAWPDLNPEEHTHTVAQLGAAFRQVNPNASPDDFVRLVGAQAMLALGITPQQANGQDEVEEAPPARPFTPAGSAPPASGKPRKPTNPVEAFDATFDTEDLDLG